jgi:uncharacterized membrane-anchored protein YhcB (DUF1043 family)
MMAPFWQEIVIGLLVAAAVAYLIVRIVRRKRTECACSRCGLMKLASGDQQPKQQPVQHH